MSLFPIPASLPFARSKKNQPDHLEDDRKKWTAELDRQLPGYKQSKSEVGRILKELRAIYGRPGCRGLWQPFLQSRGLAVSTANDLIRRYKQTSQAEPVGGNPDPEPQEPAERQPPSRMVLKLPLAIERRDGLRAAIKKLGCAQAADLIYFTLTHAAAEADIRPQATVLDETRLNADAAPNPDLNSHPAHRLESAGSGRFQQQQPPLTRPIESPKSAPVPEPLAVTASSSSQNQIPRLRIAPIASSGDANPAKATSFRIYLEASPEADPGLKPMEVASEPASEPIHNSKPIHDSKPMHESRSIDPPPLRHFTLPVMERHFTLPAKEQRPAEPTPAFVNRTTDSPTDRKADTKTNPAHLTTESGCKKSQDRLYAALLAIGFTNPSAQPGARLK